MKKIDLLKFMEDLNTKTELIIFLLPEVLSHVAIILKMADMKVF